MASSMMSETESLMSAAVAAPLPLDGNTSGAPGAASRATELLRAVRLLQTRWVEIQDAVSNMREMLQTIQEAQQIEEALRFQSQLLDGSTESNDNNNGV